MKTHHIRTHYERRIRPDRDNYDLLDWGSRAAQLARFDVLAETLQGCRGPGPGAAHPERTGKPVRLPWAPARPTLLDVGCGLSDLLTFLTERQQPVTYVGVDIVHAVLAEANRRTPGRDLMQADIFRAAPFASRAFDVVFSSGVFNLKLGNNRNFALRGLPAMLELARYCVVTNFLHRRTKKQYEHCFYFEPDELLESVAPMASETRLIDDYLENDFSLVIWR